MDDSRLLRRIPSRWACAALFAGSVVATNAAPPDAGEGEGLYARHCVHCHGGGVPRAPALASLRERTAGEVLRALETGPMRIIGNMLLNREQRVAVAEYVAGEAYVRATAPMAIDHCADPAPPMAAAGLQPSWTGWGNGLANHRFQSREAAGLAPEDVPRLALRWAFAFPEQSTVNAQPTVAAGRVFIGTATGAVYALDAASGCVRWRYRADEGVRTPVLIAADVDTASPRARAFFGDRGGMVYALDAETGEALWQRRVSRHPAASLTGGFQYHGGRLYVPVSSNEEALGAEPHYPCCTFRGALVALEATSGRILWTTHTIAETPRPTRRTANEVQLHGPSGAAVWSSPALDPRRRRIYVATGNNYSDPPTATSDAVMALDMDSGAILWTYQGARGDAWNTACLGAGHPHCPDDPGGDTDMGAAPILIDGPAGAGIVLAAQKTGVVHALAADDGRLLWQRRLGEGGISGGFQWGPAAAGGTVFAALSDIGLRPGEGSAMDVVLDPGRGGGLFALDARAGTVRWRAAPGSCAGRERCSPAQSAAVTAIPGVVFSGAVSGVLRAYSADSGAVLWAFDTVRAYETVNGVPGRGGALDGPGVVVAGGRVFAVSGYGLFGGHPGNVLLSFAP